MTVFSAHNRPDTLPRASILAKIEAFDHGASMRVIDRAAQIQQQRHSRENAAVRQKHDILTCITQVLRHSFNPCNPASQHRHMPDNSPEAMRSDWGNVGDDLRHAICEYMTRHHMTPGTLGLTRAERDSLQYAHTRRYAPEYRPGG